MPWRGFPSKDFANSSMSDFMDLCRFANAFKLFAKVGVGIILKFIEEVVH